MAKMWVFHWCSKKSVWWLVGSKKIIWYVGMVLYDVCMWLIMSCAWKKGSFFTQTKSHVFCMVGANVWSKIHDYCILRYGVVVVVVVDIPYLWLLQCSMFSHLCLFRYRLLMWHDPHLFLDFVQILLGPSLSLFFVFCLLFDVVVVVLWEKSVCLTVNGRSFDGRRELERNHAKQHKMFGGKNVVVSPSSRENRKFWSNHRFCNRRMSIFRIHEQNRKNKATLHSSCIYGIKVAGSVSVVSKCSAGIAATHCVVFAPIHTENFRSLDLEIDWYNLGHHICFYSPRLSLRHIEEFRTPVVTFTPLYFQVDVASWGEKKKYKQQRKYQQIQRQTTSKFYS